MKFKGGQREKCQLYERINSIICNFKCVVPKGMLLEPEFYKNWL